MKHLKRTLAALLALTMSLGMTACGDEASTDESSSSLGQESAYKEQDDVVSDASLVSDYIQNDPSLEKVKGSTVYWLSYYDLNPINNQDRSTALQLFEDEYGGKIEYIACTSETKFETLASRIMGGDPVDMFAFEGDAIPNGVVKNQYLPLDDYIDLSEDMWDGMSDAIEMFKYKDQHYVVPYILGDPILITYSRNLCEENGLDDPLELYEDGEWDWDAFMDMMKTFVGNAGDGETRYGINGYFGQAAIQSTGESFVNYDGKTFSNNIMNDSIERAEGMLEEIMQLGLYDPTWYSYFPDDGSTLFYAMADWALGESNVKNNPDPEFNEDGQVEEGDLMIVPFPKDPQSDEYYLSCNFAAKMLVTGAQNPEGVAAYIKCERLEAVTKEYQEMKLQKALIPEYTAAGALKAYKTEEQQKAIMEYTNPENIVPMYDFGDGMGSRMNGDGEYTYETRGIMNNLTTALLNGDRDSWAVIRDEWASVMDEIIAEYNAE